MSFKMKPWIIQKKITFTPTKQQERIQRKMFHPHLPFVSFCMNFISPKFYFSHSLFKKLICLSDHNDVIAFLSKPR